MQRILLIAVILLIAGCGPWLRAESSYVSQPLNFRMDLPSGWMRQNTPNFLCLTKDGVLLQEIFAKRMALREEKQFSRTKKRVTADMLPQEVAEVVLDDYQSELDFMDFKVEENVPADLGGLSGFRARFSYKTKAGLKYRCVCYGALSGGYLYSLMYVAAARHYFDKGLDEFETAARTFRLLKS